MSNHCYYIPGGVGIVKVGDRLFKLQYKLEANSGPPTGKQLEPELYGSRMQEAAEEVTLRKLER